MGALKHAMRECSQCDGYGFVPLDEDGRLVEHACYRCGTTGREPAIDAYTLPAHWACALLYGEFSGLEEREEREIADWLDRVKPGYCVGTDGQESHFARSNDAATLACEVMEFQFIKEAAL